MWLTQTKLLRIYSQPKNFEIKAFLLLYIPYYFVKRVTFYAWPAE